MNLWVEIDNITRRLQILHSDEARITKREPPIERLTRLNDNLFSAGVTYEDICWILAVSEHVSVPTTLEKSDFINGYNIMYSMRVSEAITALIAELEERSKEE